MLSCDAARNPDDFAPLSPDKAQLHADAVASLLGLSSAIQGISGSITKNERREEQEIIGKRLDFDAADWIVMEEKPFRVLKPLSSAEIYSGTIRMPRFIVESLFENSYSENQSKSRTVLIKLNGGSMLPLGAELAQNGSSYCVKTRQLLYELQAETGDALCLISSGKQSKGSGSALADAMIVKNYSNQLSNCVGNKKKDLRACSKIAVHADNKGTRRERIEDEAALQSDTSSPTTLESSEDVDAASALLAAGTPAAEETLLGSSVPTNCSDLIAVDLLSARKPSSKSSRINMQLPEPENTKEQEKSKRKRHLIHEVDEYPDIKNPATAGDKSEQQDVKVPHATKHSRRRVSKRKSCDAEVVQEVSLKTANSKKRGRRSHTLDTINLSCTHCGTKETPRWWKDAFPCGTLCNACGIWLKRHGYPRPVQFFSGSQGYVSVARVRISAGATSGTLSKVDLNNSDDNILATQSNSNISETKSEEILARQEGDRKESLVQELEKTHSGPSANEFYLINGRPRRRRAAAPVPGTYVAHSNEESDDAFSPKIDYEAAGDHVFVIRRKFIGCHDGSGAIKQPVSVLVHFGWSANARSAHKMFDAIVAFNNSSNTVTVEDFQLLGDTRAKALLLSKSEGDPHSYSWDDVVCQFVNSL